MMDLSSRECDPMPCDVCGDEATGEVIRAGAVVGHRCDACRPTPSPLPDDLIQF